MKRRYRHLVYVIGAQTTCFAIGLWVHQRFVSSATRSEAVDVAFAELGSVVAHLASEPGRFDPPTNTQLESLNGVRLLEVNNNWVPLMKEGDAGPPSARIAWAPRSTPGPDVRYGTFDVGDGAQLAAATSINNGSALLIAHRPRADVESECDRILASMPTIAGVTFFWTVSVAAVAGYMIMARFYDQEKEGRQIAAARHLQGRQHLIRTRDAVIFGLAKLAESRDPETGDHLERIAQYSTLLASNLRRDPRFRDRISPGFVRLIEISSALHDIGKVGIEDAILLKPHPLTHAERKRMEEHAGIGGRCLKEIEQRLGSSNFLQMAREIAFSHHERWDGTGYPNGLSGEEIPLAARIVSIADVYDALSSRRVYKEAFVHAECVDVIRSGSGRQFDPDMVDIWLQHTDRFADIARQYAKADGNSRGSTDAVGLGPPPKVSAAEELLSTA